MLDSVEVWLAATPQGGGAAYTGAIRAHGYTVLGVALIVVETLYKTWGGTRQSNSVRSRVTRAAPTGPLKSEKLRPMRTRTSRGVTNTSNAREPRYGTHTTEKQDNAGSRCSRGAT